MELCPKCNQLMTLENVKVDLSALRDLYKPTRKQLLENIEAMRKFRQARDPNWELGWDPQQKTDEQLLELCSVNPITERAVEMYVCPRCGHTESADEPDPSHI